MECFDYHDRLVRLSKTGVLISGVTAGKHAVRLSVYSICVDVFMSDTFTIAIASDSFKGSLSSAEVADSVECGCRRVAPDAEIRKIPVADGGEGTVEAVLSALSGKCKHATVTGPMNTQVDAEYGLAADSKTAVIEMATASGLPLVLENERDTLHATSYGTGELILAAIKDGAERIVMGVGGSATVDGGAGMAQALGVRFYGAGGALIPSPIVAGQLKDIARIDCSHVDPALQGVSITVACDVDNPLIGGNGAAPVFGPQKGLKEADIEPHAASLEAYARLIAAETSVDVLGKSYMGAGGGITVALHAFFGAELKPGIDLIADVIDLESQFEGADLVITGEGRIDSQTIFGKTPIGVARAAKTHGLPVIAIGGQLGDGASEVLKHGIDYLESALVPSVGVEEAMANARVYVADAAERALRVFTANQQSDK